MAEKKTKDTGGFAPNWRPDFRDNDALPDVKAVRTNFMVNLVAMAVAIILGVMLGIKEFEAMSLQGDIARLEAGIQKDSANNRNALKLSGQFEKESPKIEDLVSFYKGYQSPLEAILLICKSRPETIALNSLSVSKWSKNIGTQRKPNLVYMPQISLKGVLKGESVEALQELDKYKATLEELEAFKDKLESIDVSQPKRNPSLGMFEFSIVIKLKEPA